MKSTFSQLGEQDALNLYDQLGVENFVSEHTNTQAEVKFLLAIIISKREPEAAIQLYRQGLRLKQVDGISWYELGDLLAKTDPDAAIEAYLKSCRYGDPGKHGCYGAGRVAEDQGNIKQAIQYYRKSTWEEALARADQLEQTLP